MATKISRLQSALLNFRKTREDAKRLADAAKKTQPELIALLKSVDPENVGVVFDEQDKSKGAAFVQQNDASIYWDEEEVIQWLKKNKRLWLACSSRVFDVAKFEAMIASGEIPKKRAAKFRVTGEKPAPFIRFGKIGDGSIE